MSKDKKEPIEKALAELKKAHESKELDAIKPALDGLNEAWKAASEEMYKAQQEKGAQNKADGKKQESDSSGEDDNVEDVDFEEVKE